MCGDEYFKNQIYNIRKYETNKRITKNPKEFTNIVPFFRTFEKKPYVNTCFPIAPVSQLFKSKG